MIVATDRLPYELALPRLVSSLFLMETCIESASWPVTYATD